MSKIFWHLPSAAVFMAAIMMGAIGSAQGTGTFVAAVDGVNSFASSDGVSAFSDTTATVGFWHDRVGTFDIIGLPSPASGAYQGQNKSGAPLTFQEVVTTIDGLNPGENYDIFMIYGVSNDVTGGDQHIDAGFTSGALTTLLESGGVDTGFGLMAGGGTAWRAYEQLIGTTAADGSGEIKTYVSATLDAERSVYNGLSFQVSSVPEPSSLLLMLGIGLGAIGRRRRSS